MPFLGIDQSLSATGLCVVDDAKDVLMMTTVDPGALIGGRRLVAIKDALIAAIRGTRAGIGHAALEGYSMGSINRPFDLGEVGGIIRMVLADVDIPYVVVPPVIVKVFATGTTGATKDKMIEAAKSSGVCPKNDNEADALFLARIAHAFAHGPDQVRREMEAIRMLKNPKPQAPKRRPRKLVPAAV